MNNKKNITATALRFDRETRVLHLLDQRKLPLEEVYVKCVKYEDVIIAIQEMVVRGAPLIGLCGLYASAFCFLEFKSNSENLKKGWGQIKSARPTAVNLEREVSRFEVFVENNKNNIKIDDEEIFRFIDEVIAENYFSYEKMINHGVQILQKIIKAEPSQGPLRVMTHCHTGALATGTLGTALGVILKGSEAGLIENVWVNETRPYLQGLRLTSYELTKHHVGHKVVTDSMAAYLMQTNQVDVVFVGADRIASNGDTANKIGTLGIALLAHYFKIPFYVVAPSTSIDPKTKSGDAITIEFRSPLEIIKIKNELIAPEATHVLNPSFDVTPGHLITGIITEELLYQYPYQF